MPRAKVLDGFSPEYLTMRTDSAAQLENNDCAVKAVCAATGQPYVTVLNLFYKCGRRPRRGTPMAMTEMVLAVLGYKMVPVAMDHFITQYPAPHNNLHSCTTHHPDRFHKVWADGQTYLMRVRGHILCIKNGVNIDWSRGRAKRALALYRVEQLRSAA